jgi:hypothetical protein
LYLPPELKKVLVLASNPPQTIISVPVQTAVWKYLAGIVAGGVVIGDQVSVAGLYLAPVLVAAWVTGS